MSQYVCVSVPLPLLSSSPSFSLPPFRSSFYVKHTFSLSASLSLSTPHFPSPFVYFPLSVPSSLSPSIRLPLSGDISLSPFSVLSVFLLSRSHFRFPALQFFKTISLKLLRVLPFCLPRSFYANRIPPSLPAPSLLSPSLSLPPLCAHFPPIL